MKRLFVILLTLCMCFCGCAGKTNTPTDATTDDVIREEEQTFVAVVLKKNGDSLLVEPVKNELGCDRISFSIAGLDCEVELFDIVDVTYAGGIMESYPAQVKAVKVSPSRESTIDCEYAHNWLDKESATAVKPDTRKELVITRIYADCFFTRYGVTGEEFKFNGDLGKEWCVGDIVDCAYENAYYDEASARYEADLKSIKESIPENHGGLNTVDYKPVIYLYPEQQTEVSVTLTLKGELTCTYPKYNDGWNVSAAPDGTLTDENGKTYNYLYWEGVTDAEYDFSHGFCVKGEDTAAFLESALEKLGLNRREANEFIVYWLPMMEVNPYNVISFQGEAYTDAADLAVTPAPDTLIRVFMAWKRSDEAVDIPAQSLCAPKREGFTVIEWGGTEVK